MHKHASGKDERINNTIEVIEREKRQTVLQLLQQIDTLRFGVLDVFHFSFFFSIVFTSNVMKNEGEKWRTTQFKY
jgi:hypothetical protein